MKSITPDVFNGVNCTIMAYGQTGSGKTYTIFGKEWTSDIVNSNSGSIVKEKIYFNINPESEYNGVIPRTIQSVFSYIERQKRIAIQDSYSVVCSYLQIYNERIYDLLNVFNFKFSIYQYLYPFQFYYNKHRRKITEI